MSNYPPLVTSKTLEYYYRYAVFGGIALYSALYGISYQQKRTFYTGIKTSMETITMPKELLKKQPRKHPVDQIGWPFSKETKIPAPKVKKSKREYRNG